MTLLFFFAFITIGFCQQAQVIRAIMANKCVTHDPNENSERLYAAPCNGGINQQWTYDGVHIQSLFNRKCFDIAGWNGRDLIGHVNCHDGGNQKFYFEGNLLKDRYYSKCIEIAGGIGGSELYAQGCTGQDNQKWAVEPASNYQVLNVVKALRADRCITLDPNPGNERLYVTNCHGGPDQLWVYDGERLQSVQNKKCFDVYGLNHRDLIGHPCHYGFNQRFYLDGSLLKDKEMPRCVEINGGLWGTELYSVGCTGGENQLWVIEPLRKIDCVMGNWNGWSGCSATCGGGTQTNTRGVVQQPMYGGSPCGEAIMVQSCNGQSCPVHCELGQWNGWSSCSTTCGGGSQTNTRVVIRQPEFGGNSCGETRMERICNDQPCPVDCLMGSWTEWGVCSKTCEGGSQSRSRSIDRQSSNGGKSCTETIEVRKCNEQPCPVDCVMGSWTEWSECTKKCGSGSQSKSRSIDKQPSNGGKSCTETIEIRKCNEQPCPVDCVMGSWTEWSECTKECGSGSQSRSRSIDKQSSNGGKSCTETVEVRKCNEQACSVDCVMGSWTEWGVCSKPCGSGTQSRSRSINKHPSNNGKSCTTTIDVRKCNEHPCKVDCEMSAWGEWKPCDKSCDTGMQSRERFIVHQASNGGRKCSETKEVRSCTNLPCPVHQWNVSKGGKGGHKLDDTQDLSPYNSFNQSILMLVSGIVIGVALTAVLAIAYHRKQNRDLTSIQTVNLL